MSHKDKSTVARELIDYGWEFLMIKLYREGKLSLSTLADILIIEMKASRMATKMRMKGIAERSTFVALCLSVVNALITGLATRPRINVTTIAMKRPTGIRRRLFAIITPKNIE